MKNSFKMIIQVKNLFEN